MGDLVTQGQDEVPEVVVTLAGLLPQFRGDDLEAQLQTYDTFLDTLSTIARFKIAQLLDDAAKKTTDARARARIEWAVQNIRTGGRAAAPYDHAEAMAEYRKKFAEGFPAPAPEPVAPVDANAEVFGAPGPKREHPKLLKKLDEIEAEMRKIGYWADEPPVEFDAKLARSEIHSVMDAPTFELWLQRVFLPRARAASRDDTLPKESQVGQMAFRQWDYMDCVTDAHGLVRLLGGFDELVGLASVGGA